MTAALAGGGTLFKLLAAGKALTLVSALGSFGLYALYFRNPMTAAGLVAMILVHEMGHVVEIRRQGMTATAPVFIPFFGAAIFQRSRPLDALRQAQIGIAGPIAGTLGATAAFVLYRATGLSFLLGWAWIGFLINLINLAPLGMLDGGWILGAVSKWFHLLGLALLALTTVFLGLSPVFIILVLAIGFPAIMERFANDRAPYYQSVPAGARLALGAAWLGLVSYLVAFLVQASQLIRG